MALPPPNFPIVPSVTGLDVVIPPTSNASPPASSPQAGNFTGTPGTGGTRTIGTYHGSAIPEPHREFKFDVVLPEIPGVTRPIVQGMTSTFDNTKPEGHPIGGRNLYIADFFDPSEIGMVLYNDAMTAGGNIIACTPLDYILAWKKLIRPYNQSTGLDDGTYSYPLTYWKDIYVYILDMQSNIVYTIQYVGCFPTATEPLHLEYESANRSTIKQLFSVNRVKTLRSAVLEDIGGVGSFLPNNSITQNSVQALSF